MNETIPCPKHGEQPALANADGFTQCRRCWYWEFIRGVLRWPGLRP